MKSFLKNKLFIVLFMFVCSLFIFIGSSNASTLNVVNPFNNKQTIQIVMPKSYDDGTYSKYILLFNQATNGKSVTFDLYLSNCDFALQPVDMSDDGTVLSRKLYFIGDKSLKCPRLF